MAKQAVTPREKDFSSWYQDVVTNADLADQSPVRGCMIFKPNGFAIWENIQSILDQAFKNSGHVNVYFPLLIPHSFLEKEKKHIDGFSPELALVTHAGGKELEEALVVRPTSEAIIGNAFSKWIKSYRDLPVLLNQWCNVMRWEMRPRMFLRNSEFLWQEGHTAHATLKEAEAETLKMHEIYANFLNNDCLIPSFTGKKPEHEKFPGALSTYTLESLMQDGKALQMGTSHNLGQNFSQVFSIKYLNKDNKQEFVWTTSWGVSTRLIGGIIMTHGDDDGAIFPPNIAPVKIVIVPIVDKAENSEHILNMADICKQKLAKKIPIWQITTDNRYNLKPSDRFFHWIRRGVPVRLMIGKLELEQGIVTIVLRHNRKKIAVKIDELENEIDKIFAQVNQDLYQRATELRDNNLVRIDDYKTFKDFFAQKSGFAYSHWDGSKETAEKIKQETKATIRVIPNELEVETGKCVFSGKVSARRVLFAIAY